MKERWYGCGLWQKCSGPWAVALSWAVWGPSNESHDDDDDNDDDNDDETTTTATATATAAAAPAAAATAATAGTAATLEDHGEGKADALGHVYRVCAADESLDPRRNREKVLERVAEEHVTMACVTLATRSWSERSFDMEMWWSGHGAWQSNKSSGSSEGKAARWKYAYKKGPGPHHPLSDCACL